MRNDEEMQKKKETNAINVIWVVRSMFETI